MARNALTNLWIGDGRLRRDPEVAAILLQSGLRYGTPALAAALRFGRGWWPTAHINPDHLINLLDFDERLILGTLALFGRIHGRVPDPVKTLSEQPPASMEPLP